MGLGGALWLFVASTLALANWVGLANAAFIVAGAGILVSAICFVICLRPFRPIEDEVSDAESAAADALADLPIDTVRSFVERRPLTTTALAMAVGYSVVRHPHTVQRHAERYILSLL